MKNTSAALTSSQAIDPVSYVPARCGAAAGAVTAAGASAGTASCAHTGMAGDNITNPPQHNTARSRLESFMISPYQKEEGKTHSRKR
jgi:hypothetical protein